MEITEAPSAEEAEGRAHHDGRKGGEGHEHTTDKIHLNSSTRLVVTTSTFLIALTSLTDGINVRISLTSPLTLEAHGLIGQTWRSKRENLHQHSAAASAPVASHVDSDESEEGEEDSMEHVEGAMADYRLRDGGLFSEQFEFNLYESGQDEADDDDDDDENTDANALNAPA